MEEMVAVAGAFGDERKGEERLARAMATRRGRARRHGFRGGDREARTLLALGLVIHEIVVAAPSHSHQLLVF